MNRPLSDFCISIAMKACSLNPENANHAMQLWRQLCVTPKENHAELLDALRDPEITMAAQDVRQALLLADQLLRGTRGSGKTRTALSLASLAATQQPAIPRIAHILLHAVVPKVDRDTIERDLEEQLEEEMHDALIGLRWARLLYRKRVADNILAYTWGRLPKRVRTIIVSAIAAGVLKSLGLLPTLAVLKDLAALLWK